MLDTHEVPERAAETCCPIVELRQYTLKPGRRDDLITLFEDHFIEGQEKYGMRVIGQFRNHVSPDQFVWLRGFADMGSRRPALQGFYYGPIWQAHRAAANDTIIDSDNVLLLKSAHTAASFYLDPTDRPARDAPELAGGIIITTIYAFDALVKPQFVDFFEREIAPVLREAGAKILGQFVTMASENTFPALPVRENEHVFVWFASFVNEAAYAAYHSALAENQTWTASLVPALKGWLSKPEEVLELLPTRRSLLRHW